MTEAYRLSDLAVRGPWGKTKLYDFVKKGTLPARKRDGTTFVIAADWERFLAGAPLALDARQPDPSSFL